MLYVVDQLEAAGAEMLTVRIATSVDRARWEPTVVATRRGGPLADLLRDAEVPLEVLDRQGRYDMGPLRRLRRAIGRADVVHSHMFGSNASAALTGVGLSAALVTHEHNEVNGFSHSQQLAWRTLIGRRSAAVCCVSSEVADTVGALGVSRRKLHVIPTGVPEDRALTREQARTELGLDPDRPIVGITAALRPEKDHRTLLAAFALVVADVPDAQLMAIGDGAERAGLEAHAAELGIADRVLWMGSVSDAARVAAAPDVAVMASTTEGLPLSALETMMAGVPLVTTAVGGLVPLLADDRGILVPVGDAPAMAAAISDLLRKPDLRSAIAERARAYAIATHGMRGYTAELERLYDAVSTRR